MMTIKTVIFILLVFGDSIHAGGPPPDFGSSEQFLKDVNAMRSKFAKEYNIPNMYKLYWSEELANKNKGTPLSGYRLMDTQKTYQKLIEDMKNDYDRFKIEVDFDDVVYNKDGVHRPYSYFLAEFLNPLQKFIGCYPGERVVASGWALFCLLGSANTVNFWYAKPKKGPATQCPIRFKAEDGLCVPVDPSKNTFWGNPEDVVGDLNFMRRKYAKEYGIPDMHQLSWNQSLADRLKPVDLFRRTDYTTVQHYYSDRKNPKFFDEEYCKIWRYTELPTFSSAATMADESIHRFMIFERERANGHGQDRLFLNLIDDHSGAELVHPLQTGIGCMRKIRHSDYGDGQEMVICLMGNARVWPESYKMTINSTKVPGSECMDDYMNSDGLCILDKKKQEQREKAAASSSAGYGLWILGLIVSLFF